jgi:glycosyltransferase involved in cell wall biosynthesis
MEGGHTGFLVPASDAQALSERLTLLLRNTDLRARMGNAAAEAARRQIDLRRQADAYLGWYQKIIEVRNSNFEVRTAHN